MDYHHRLKVERIFRAKFDDTVGPRMGIPQDVALQSGLDEWNRWLRDNRIHSRHYADNQIYDGLVQIYDPTGFKILFVPIDLAQKALVLGSLP
jgi:hypothetical protein